MLEGPRTEAMGLQGARLGNSQPHSPPDLPSPAGAPSAESKWKPEVEEVSVVYKVQQSRPKQSREDQVLLTLCFISLGRTRNSPTVRANSRIPFFSSSVFNDEMTKKRPLLITVNYLV